MINATKRLLPHYAVFNTTHVATSYMFVTLSVIYVLAALLHLYLRNGIFRRMWPAHGSL